MTPNDPIEQRLRSVLHASLTASRADAFEARIRAACRGPNQVTMPSGGRSRRRILISAFAAGALLVAATAGASRMLFPDEPQPALERALASTFDRNGCLDANAARRAVRNDLDGLGYDDWTIAARQGAGQARCVAAAVDASHHEVLLLPATGGDLIRALDGVRAELLERCLDREGAMRLVRSVLVSMHVDDEWRVRADPDGPRPVPIGPAGEAVQRHAAEGCYVLAGTPNHGYVDVWSGGVPGPTPGPG